jgi:hypothetical protein
MFTERPYEVYSGFHDYGYAVNASPVDAHNLFKTGNFTHEVLSSDRSLMREILVEADKILPFAAEAYQISSNIKDYVVVPVPIMPSELPNRNGVGFPFVELTRFNSDVGELAYKTWKFMPTHQEHANRDITKAKGMVLDASLRKMDNVLGGLYKVVLLCAFDRSKDPILANSILTKESTAYSMGALSRDYHCSICHASVSKGGCEHAVHGKPAMRIYDNRLAYLQVSDFKGFELSSVKVPAYSGATNPDYFSME